MTQATAGAWWQNAVIYQIYPRSFQDSNGDGIGDLPGITQRLDYLQDLGVDALWLSPIFTSPMYDFGYDISDYRGIDPVFGTLAEFKQLVHEADRRRIRIVLDGVFNHTSHQHPWFQESRSSTTNPKRDWYLWRARRNNWLSIFGGSGWQRDPTTREYYYHSFLTEQPDLNWRNPAVKRAVFDDLRYWLDLGVAGFRFDVINFFFKDAKFRNNPLGLGPTPRPYDLQRHLYDRNRPEVHDLLKDLRELADEYDAMTVGEVFSETPDARLAASYLGRGDQLHMAFDFSLMYSHWGAAPFRRLLRAYHDQIHPDAWPCTVLSNHDQPRSLTRFGKRDTWERARLLAVLLLTMRGTPFVYYGEEIGMRDLQIRRRQIVDPLGKRYWPFHKGRDPARTPMQWSNARHAGFSSVRPWLPVHPDAARTHVAGQQGQAGSLLETYRSLIALRRAQPSLRNGELLLDSGAPHDEVLRYRRGALTILLNFSHRPQAVGSGAGQPILYSTHRAPGRHMEPDTRLHPYEGIVLGGEAPGTR